MYYLYYMNYKGSLCSAMDSEAIDIDVNVACTLAHTFYGVSIDLIIISVHPVNG